MAATSALILALLACAAASDVITGSRQRRAKFRLGRDEWFDAQFTGHPKFACAKTGFPSGGRFEEYKYRFLFKAPEASKSLFCVLKGTSNEFQEMVRRIGLHTSSRKNRRGGSVEEVTAPSVSCVVQPKLLATLFDLVVVNGNYPHDEAWCLLARAPPPPHSVYGPRFPEPAGGALAIRFNDEEVPDVLCSPHNVLREDENGQEERVGGPDFFVQGLTENWQRVFACDFKRSENSTEAGPSARTLLLRVVLPLGLSTGTYQGRPLTWLPAETCRAACPEAAPRPDDLAVQLGAYRDDHGVDVAMTSPGGRTATCDVPERNVFHAGGSSYSLEAVLPGRPSLVCHSQSLPLGDHVDGTDFYFIVRLELHFNRPSVFRCKVKHGQHLGGDPGVRAVALEMAQQLGLHVSYDDAELGRVVPSVQLGVVICDMEPPVGDFVHQFQAREGSSTLHCAFGDENNKTLVWRPSEGMEEPRLGHRMEPTPPSRLLGAQ